MGMLKRTQEIVNQLSCELLGKTFKIRVEGDAKFVDNGRVFVQMIYESPCTKTDTIKEWRGRKWYLSEYMTNDEIVKTVFLAFEIAVRHEILEGFKVNGKPLFNPHVNYEALLDVSHKEVKRAPEYTEHDLDF